MNNYIYNTENFFATDFPIQQNMRGRAIPAVEKYSSRTKCLTLLRQIPLSPSFLRKYYNYYKTSSSSLPDILIVSYWITKHAQYTLSIRYFSTAMTLALFLLFFLFWFSTLCSETDCLKF